MIFTYLNISVSRSEFIGRIAGKTLNRQEYLYSVGVDGENRLVTC